jgi:hypothetical protein
MDVWYVSYGSNVSLTRLSCYLAGGRADGSMRHNPGARNAALPRDDRVIDLPGLVSFVGSSPQWLGGVAWYDHDTPGPAHGRAWLLESSQLEDLVAQENHVPVGSVAIGPELWEAGGLMDVPAYRRLVRFDDIDGVAAYTFTRPDRLAPTPPSPAYLDTIGRGLIEAGIDEAVAAAYLARCV